MKKLLLLIIVAVSCQVSAFAQIPNGSFENWTAGNPDDWSTANPYTSAINVFTCTQGTPGNPGSSYLNLTSKFVPLLGKVVSGMAFSGEVNVNLAAGTIVPKGGFAFSQRPQKLTGNWQYMAMSAADQGFIGIALTKWNASAGKRDTVAVGFQNLTGMVMSWTPFSVPLNYLKTSNPDSCMIWLSASNPATAVANSYLYVDGLAFSGTVSGLSANLEAVSDLNVYPNPARENLTIAFATRKPEELTLELTDVMGKVVKNIYAGPVAGNYAKELPVSDLAKGLYLLKITSAEAFQVKRIVIE